VVELIQYAISNKLKVRVRGAAQSIPAAVFADGYNPPPGSAGENINIQLDQLRSFVIDAQNKRVTVGGGINLGFDPFDPSKASKEDNSNNLFYQLNQNGLAIANVPEETHQTISGYLSTGSSGGTMQHAIDDAVVSFRLVDGTGRVQTFSRSDNMDDAFYGLLVSMGLMGVITEVTLQCIPAFNIIGSEAITDVTATTFDFFGEGSTDKPSLQTYITNAEFSRTLWWPIDSLHRVIAWSARTMTAADYNSNTGTPTAFKPKPYAPLFPSWDMGTTIPSEFVASTGFQLIATWPDWAYVLLNLNPALPGASDNGAILAVEAMFPLMYPMLANMYFPVNTANKPAKTFWDYWLNSLPMDEVEFASNLFDLTYAEMWIPANLASKTVNALQDYYLKNGYQATSFYTVEILAAKKSNFWLSPAYGTDVIRINIMYFRRAITKPMDYFAQFWQLLKDNDIPFRPHWGKALPPPSSSTGANYVTAQ
jgi:hypothetical protein